MLRPARRPKDLEHIHGRIEEIWLEHGAKLRAKIDSLLKEKRPDLAPRILSRFHDQLFFLLADVDSAFDPPKRVVADKKGIDGQEAFEFEAAETKSTPVWVRIPNPGDWDLAPNLAKTHKREVLRSNGRLLEAVLILEEKEHPVWVVTGRIVDMDSGRDLNRFRRKFKTREGAESHFEKIKQIMLKEARREQD